MGKRLIALISAFVLLFTGLTGRCAYIALSKTYSVSDTYNSYSIEIGSLYSTIYDRVGNRLNNNSVELVAVIRPNEKALSELDSLFDEKEIADITNELKNGYPIIRTVDKKVNLKYINIYERIIENPDDMLARHMIDRNYGGLESYASEELGSLKINFGIDALGRLFAGDEGNVIDNNYSSVEGYVVSIDSKLQRIAEEASKKIPKGAVVIMDTQTSQILASVSRGNDYLNRPIMPYAIGSVFKLVVCACALENGINQIYNCNSSITVGDTTFSCQKNKSHGIQTMSTALANSCNCYFVNLALTLGAEKLYKTANALGFGQGYNIYADKEYDAGVFPSIETLSSDGQLALIGFGQGMLTESPVHFASVVSCIANAGNYIPPTLDIIDAEENIVLKKSTCEKLRAYMKNVVSNGTGSGANYKNQTAGKTATAQSGIYINEKEVLNTWFAGFYPYDNPKYTIVVLREDGESGAADCCPVFRTIVEKIDNM